MRAEQVTAVCTVHGEGAVWSDAWGGLRFVDMLAGDVLALTAGGEVQRRDVGAVAACVRPRTGGGMVVALERGFALFDEADQRQWVTDVWDAPDVRMNEGSCDPDAMRAALQARQPMGRLVSAPEVANAIVYLASPAAASTTGTLLAVDGGMTGVQVL